jgi:hypothetical protein
MSRMNSKRKRRSKAVPVLGAAGLSLTLASEGSLATTAPALDTMTRNVTHEITLREEEACDVSLATFHVFGKEGAKNFRAGKRPITLGQGCCLFACLAGQTSTEAATPTEAAAPVVPPASRGRSSAATTEKDLDQAEGEAERAKADAQVAKASEALAQRKLADAEAALRRVREEVEQAKAEAGRAKADAQGARESEAAVKQTR